jgi:hypothetical protein
VLKKQFVFSFHTSRFTLHIYGTKVVEITDTAKSEERVTFCHILALGIRVVYILAKQNSCSLKKNKQLNINKIKIVNYGKNYWN